MVRYLHSVCTTASMPNEGGTLGTAAYNTLLGGTSPAPGCDSVMHP